MHPLLITHFILLHPIVVTVIVHLLSSYSLSYLSIFNVKFSRFFQPELYQRLSSKCFLWPFLIVEGDEVNVCIHDFLSLNLPVPYPAFSELDEYVLYASGLHVIENSKPVFSALIAPYAHSLSLPSFRQAG